MVAEWSESLTAPLRPAITAENLDPETREPCEAAVLTKSDWASALVPSLACVDAWAELSTMDALDARIVPCTEVAMEDASLAWTTDLEEDEMVDDTECCTEEPVDPSTEEVELPSTDESAESTTFDPSEWQASE